VVEGDEAVGVFGPPRRSEKSIKNDPAILPRWHGNKTVENFIAWIGAIRQFAAPVLRNGQWMACVKMRKTIALRTNSDDRSGSI
jgi:hypothetical protein